MSRPQRRRRAPQDKEALRRRLLWRGVVTCCFAGLVFGGLFVTGAYGNWSRGAEPLIWASEGLTGVAVLAASMYGMKHATQRLHGEGHHGHDH